MVDHPAFDSRTSVSIFRPIPKANELDGLGVTLFSRTRVKPPSVYSFVIFHRHVTEYGTAHGTAWVRSISPKSLAKQVKGNEYDFDLTADAIVGRLPLIQFRRVKFEVNPRSIATDLYLLECHFFVREIVYHEGRAGAVSRTWLGIGEERESDEHA